MLSDKQLAAIRNRLSKATQGPWHATTVDSVAGGMIYGQGWCVAEATIYPDGWTADFPHARRTFIDTDANADLIGHAPEDLAALLEDYAEMRKVVERIDGLYRDCTGEIVTDSPYEMKCSLCHQRVTGPDLSEFGVKRSHSPYCIVPICHKLVEKSKQTK